MDVRGFSVHEGGAGGPDRARDPARGEVLPAREREAGRAPREDGDVPGAVLGGSEHGRGDVRVGGDGGVLGGDVRAVM